MIDAVELFVAASGRFDAFIQSIAVEYAQTEHGRYTARPRADYLSPGTQRIQQYLQEFSW